MLVLAGIGEDSFEQDDAHPSLSALDSTTRSFATLTLRPLAQHSSTHHTSRRMRPVDQRR